jgi:tRNA dimethylallyltransferase
MSIGTAKPTPEEQCGVKHYFINSNHISKPISSGQFEQQALRVLETIYEKENHAILVGGSGMFINALIYGTDQLPQDQTIREALNVQFKTQGITPLLEELAQKDANYFEEVDKNNPVRVIRALEVIRASGEKYSNLRTKTVRERPFSIHYFVINHSRETLYDRINQRVEQMISNGLVGEVKALSAYKDLQVLNTVGYKEIFQYLEGEFDLTRAIELIKRNTRRYAKRQLTWFRRDSAIKWIPFGPIKSMIDIIQDEIENNS